MNLNDLKDKKIAIWGFGVEGQASAEYLKSHGMDFIVLSSESEKTERYEFCTKLVTAELLNQFDVIVKSPGISPYQDLIENSEAQYTSSTALWFANEKKNKVIAISGTKGKSTTSSMLAHVLEELGIDHQLVGNIGDPLLSVKQSDQWVIFECSSYQACDGKIRADVGLMTNLYPEHLNWHLSLENYYNDKLKLLDHCAVKVINAESSELMQRTAEMEKVLFNNKAQYHVDAAVLKNDGKSLLELSEVQVLGEHNLQNMAAVLTVCRQLGLDEELCVEHLKSFKPLQHRLQQLGLMGRHIAVNDSISSTPHATMAALKALKNHPETTLLLGGFDRKVSWKEFAEYIRPLKLNSILISGENSGSILESLQPLDLNLTKTIEMCEDLREAICRAVECTPENGVILLSPGSPSFDQFKNFKQRGEFFIHELGKYA